MEREKERLTHYTQPFSAPKSISSVHDGGNCGGVRGGGGVGGDRHF